MYDLHVYIKIIFILRTSTKTKNIFNCTNYCIYIKYNNLYCLYFTIILF